MVFLQAASIWLIVEIMRIFLPVESDINISLKWNQWDACAQIKVGLYLAYLGIEYHENHSIQDQFKPCISLIQDCCQPEW